MEEWPESLPQYPLIDGYTEKLREDAVLRTEVETGLAKQRPRYTTVPSEVEETFLMTNAQYNTFKDFFENNLSFGAIPFIKKNPITDQNVNYRFIENYEPEFLGLHVRVECVFERFNEAFV